MNNTWYAVHPVSALLLLTGALMSCGNDALDTASAGLEETGTIESASNIDSLAVSPDAVQLLLEQEVGQRWVRPDNAPIYEIAGIQLKDSQGHGAGAVSIWSTSPSATNCRWKFDENGVATQDGRLTEDGVVDPRIEALTAALREGRDPGETGLDLFTLVVGARRDLPPVISASLGLPDFLTESGDDEDSCDWYSRVVDPSDGSLWVSCKPSHGLGGEASLFDPLSRKTLDVGTLMAHEASAPLRTAEYAEAWNSLEAAVAPTPEDLGGGPGLAPILLSAGNAYARGSDSLTGSMACYLYNSSTSSYDTTCSTTTCSCSCGTNYGTSKGSLDGHTTYYDGSTCTGSYCAGTYSGTAFRCWGAYQCVEYVKRFRHLSGTTGDAYYWWNSPYKSTYAIRPLFQMANGGSYAPNAGDVLYSCSGSCGTSSGHVGIIDTPGTSTINHYDQNFTSASQPVSLTYSTSGSTYTIGSRSTSYATIGWLRTGWEFYYSSSSPMYGWSATNISTVSYGTSGSTTYARLTSMSSDPYTTGPDNLGVNPSTTYGGRYVSIRLRTNASNRTLRVYFITTSDTTWNESKAVSATIPSGTGWSTVDVDMSTNSTWTSSSSIIRRIRVDPVASVSSTSEYVDIDYIRFKSN